MGSAAAFFLAKRIPPSSICVLERDPTYSRASTPVSVGGIRYQFSNEENIRLSMFGMDFFDRIETELEVEGFDRPDVQRSRDGYLFLASSAGEPTLRDNYELQRSLGADVEFLTRGQLADRFPWINCEDLAAATLGVKGGGEGWFDPWLLLTAFRRKAAAMGVHFIHASLTGVIRDGVTVSGVKVQQHRVENKTAGEDLACATELVGCDYLVNCGGAWAANIAAMAGIGEGVPFSNIKNPYRHQWANEPRLAVSLPVRPRKRMVFPFEQRNGPKDYCPLVVDPSGVYFRREGLNGRFLTGTSPPSSDDPDTDSLEVDDDFFLQNVWPHLAHRAPVFESLKLQTSWAGFYDTNTFDCNGIVGFHPVVRNLVFANGFSGHGIQQGPAVGRAVSELVLDGQSHSIDLARFGFQRFIEGNLCSEKNIV